MISFNRVRKSYLSKDILADVTFRIEQGERVGIVGPNGAGKSTVFGMINGDVEPDKGEVIIPGSASIGYLRQQLSSADSCRKLLDFTADALPELEKIHNEIEALEEKLGNLSGKEAERALAVLGELQSRFESSGGYEMTVRAKAVLSGLGFPENRFDEPLESFSGGWQMRASLARVLVAEPAIMLLDEPSNYLDTPAVEWLTRFLSSYKGTMLLISHDRFLLKSLTAVTIEVNGGLVTRYPGNYDFYVREREQRFASLQAAKKNQEQKKAKMERFVERFRAKSTKSSQAKSKLKQIERMEEIIIPDSLAYSGTIQIPPPPHSGAETIRLENVSFSYDGRNKIIENVDFQIERGAKFALVGYNGTGKTTLLKLLAGVLEPDTGKRVLGHKVVVGYQAQEFGEILPPTQSVLDVVRSAAPGGTEMKKIRATLGSFGFSGDDISKLCGVLSGGEKIRLLFARIFVNPPNFLLLDEPTTHLDIVSREALQDALKNYQGTLCLVSHDIEFLRNTAEMIVEMVPPGIKRYFGNYNYFLEKRAIANHEKEANTEHQPKVREGNRREERREKARLRATIGREKKKIEQRISSIEHQIEKLEIEKTAVISELEENKPGLNFCRVNRRLTEIEREILQLTEEWEQKTEKVLNS